ncbi:MAG: hypothetical protein PW735_04430 [Acidobacteriaceae bacterium]|nr:hypothetical protein [Acidobacteriaceae bacterium]
MSAAHTLTILWLVAFAIFVLAMVYRAQLTQHETDELFLDDNADELPRKQEHDEIVRRVNFIHPFCQGAGGVTAVLSITLLGMEIAKVLPYVHF